VKNDAMSPRGLTVTTDVRRPLTSAEQANLTSLAPEFTLELPQSGRVELVVTDRFERVAGEYDVRALHRSNEAMTAADYAAARPDGAFAVGKTVELPDGQVAVVVSTDLLGEHSLARHTMLHEAQHVRLIQHGDGAHAVHRRWSFTLTDEFTWEFLWIAESAVDEFRCERAMYERAIPDRDTGSVVSDYIPIRALFDQAWRNLARTDDLLAAYRPRDGPGARGRAERPEPGRADARRSGARHRHRAGPRAAGDLPGDGIRLLPHIRWRHLPRRAPLSQAQRVRERGLTQIADRWLSARPRWHEVWDSSIHQHPLSGGDVCG
jgi:hypothetical protein